MMQNKGTKTLETQRLILRQFRLADADEMFQNWASDPEVTTYLTWPPHKTAELTSSLLTDWIARYDDPSWYNWAIEYKEIGQIIGNISVVKLDEELASADIGYCMGKAWWGQAIMPEALKAVIAYLFEKVGVNRVAACHDSNNPKSGRVMDKAGMKREGMQRQAARNNQGICDRVWHSILRSEYEVQGKSQNGQENVCHSVLPNQYDEENRIRRAEPRDIPDIMDLLVQVDMVHHNDRPDLFKGPATKYTEEELGQIIENDNTPVFVCVNQEDHVLGHAFCILKQYENDAVMTDIRTLYIDDLCVDETVRGQHVGQSLYRHVVQYAKEIGCYNITLNVWYPNESAMKFYEKCGLLPQKIGMEQILG